MFILVNALLKRNPGMTLLVGIIFILCIGGMTGAISILMGTAEGKKECLVSGIVFDILYSTSMISPSRIWVHPGQFSLWSGQNASESVLMSVRLKDHQKLNDFKSQLDKAFPDLILSLGFDYVTFKMMTNLFNNVVSMILLIVTVILILISAGIIFFVILGEIIYDYTHLGVFKGLGFSNKKLKAVNFSRYILLLLGVSPVGFITGAVIANGVISQYSKVTGGIKSHVMLAVPAAITLFAIAAILFAAVNLSMRKLKKLEPANAIRFGYSGRGKEKKWNMMLSNTALDLAIREIWLYWFKSVMKIVIAGTLAMLLFLVGLLNSAIEGVFSSEDVTIGMPHCDIIIQSGNILTFEEGKQILEKVKRVEAVKVVIPSMMNTQSFISGGDKKVNVFVYAFDSYNGNTGLKVLEGNNPQNEFEAAVSAITLKKLGKKVGDMMTINIDGDEGTFLVTGSFQITSNMGNAVRITSGACKKAMSNTGYNWYAISIKEGSDVKYVKQSLQRILGERATVSITREYIESFVGGFIKGVDLLNVILIGITALICGAALFNIIQLHVKENRKIYGILKGVGMSGKMINQIQYMKMLMITTLGIIIGLVLTGLLAPGMFTAIFASIGLKKNDYSYSLSGVLLVLGVTYPLTLASTFLALRKQRKTNLRELIIE